MVRPRRPFTTAFHPPYEWLMGVAAKLSTDVSERPHNKTLRPDPTSKILCVNINAGIMRLSLVPCLKRLAKLMYRSVAAIVICVLSTPSFASVSSEVAFKCEGNETSRLLSFNSEAISSTATQEAEYSLFIQSSGKALKTFQLGKLSFNPTDCEFSSGYIACETGGLSDSRQVYFSTMSGEAFIEEYSETGNESSSLVASKLVCTLHSQKCSPGPCLEF